MTCKYILQHISLPHDITISMHSIRKNLMIMVIVNYPSRGPIFEQFISRLRNNIKRGVAMSILVTEYHTSGMSECDKKPGTDICLTAVERR